MTTTHDPYAGSRQTTEGRVYTVTGGDWDQTFGGVPVEYHDATIPPPDTRRSYR